MPYQPYELTVQPRDSVLKLAEAMEIQLRANEDKPSWRYQTAEHLYIQAMQSFQKANNAFLVDDAASCKRYLTNTANYIMMFRENIDNK